jgi:hypothetical protein
MDQSTGNVGAAIFAAHGPARHRMVRAAVAGAAGLLAAWLIALALGVLGGFGSLPGLPSAQPSGSSEASTRVRHAKDSARAVSKASARPIVDETPAPAGPTGSSPTQSKSSAPKTTVTPVAQQPSTSSATTSTGHGQSATRTTQTTGKPVGSPGNGAGGSGAPGQLR